MWSRSCAGIACRSTRVVGLSCRAAHPAVSGSSPGSATVEQPLQAATRDGHRSRTPSAAKSKPVRSFAWSPASERRPLELRACVRSRRGSGAFPLRQAARRDSPERRPVGPRTNSRSGPHRPTATTPPAEPPPGIASSRSAQAANPPRARLGKGSPGRDRRAQATGPDVRRCCSPARPVAGPAFLLGPGPDERFHRESRRCDAGRVRPSAPRSHPKCRRARPISLRTGRAAPHAQGESTGGLPRRGSSRLGADPRPR